MKFAPTFLPILFVAFLPVSAAADQSPTETFCGHEVKSRSRVVMFGYEPAAVVSKDADKPFAAGHSNSMRGELALRLKLHCRYLHLEFEPYTVVPYGENRVNLAGIQTNILFPVTDRLRVGLYHHSSHNFSNGGYGIGIELNAIAVDYALWRSSFSLAGSPADLQLRLIGHQYATRKASPYVMTGDTSIAAGDIGSTGLRAGLEFEAEHPRVTWGCGTSLASQDVAPASWRLGCAGAVRVGRGLLDDFGDRFWTGLFFNYGQNFQRIKAFGRIAATGGLFVEIPFADDTVYPFAR